jgi:hypothetical protein
VYLLMHFYSEIFWNLTEIVESLRRKNQTLLSSKLGLGDSACKGDPRDFQPKLIMNKLPSLRQIVEMTSVVQA